MSTNGNDNRVTRQRLPRWAARSLFVATAVAAGLATAFGTYATSVEPGAAIVKAVFEARPEVTPPAHYASIATHVRETRRVAIATRDAPDATVDVYAPRGTPHAPLPVILWIHGGGFVSSSADTVKDYVTLLASRGFVVANLDYSIAPSARHPVPVDQANAALSYLDAHASQYGGSSSRIFLGGDSAGAQIASELAAVQTNPRLASALRLTPAISPSQLRGVVLFCGLYDMKTVAATDFPGLRTYLWAYTGSRNWSDYPGIDQLSTTRTATSSYPPTFLSVGDADPFHTQATELAARLRAKDVPVTTLFWDGTGDDLGHEYQFDFSRPQATRAFNATLRFLNIAGGIE